MKQFIAVLKKTGRRFVPLLLVVMLLVTALNLKDSGHTSAATYFTKTTVAPLSMNATAANTVVAVDFTTATADGAASITINWSALTGGSVASVAGFATSYNGTACNTASYFGAGATVLPTTTPSVSGSGTQITLTGVNALAATTQYCFFVGTTTGMTNPNAGTYTVTVQDGAADQSTVGVDYIANDQVVVSATVPPQFTMALSSNTDTMGNLLIASAVYSGGVNATINTNAANGWLLWAEDTNAGLKSATAGNHVIPSVATGANFNFSAGAGTEHYGLAVASVSSGSANAFYAYGGGTTGGGLSATVFNQIASLTGSAASGDVINIKEVADISATTPAASDYTDTVTLVGAGSF